MNTSVILSGDERNLVIELLEQERRALPPEIRHTDRLAYRAELHARMKMVDDLLGRLRVDADALPAAGATEIEI